MFKRLLLSFLISTWAFTSSSFAQDSEEESQVLAAIDALYESIYTRNRSAMLAITVPGSLNYSIADPALSAQDYIVHNYTQSVNMMMLDGPEMSGNYRDPIVLIEGNIAVFWAEYDFFLNGEFDHCGVDSFQLIKRNDKWLITNMASTRKYEGCEQ